MLQVKITLFFLIIITIRFIFIYINDIGDKKVIMMKEIIDFTDFLRIYSCDMKMNFEEILLKFHFKSDELRIICCKLFEEIKNSTNISSAEKDFTSFIEENVMTPNEFNIIFADIINYYGNTYSDILEKKLMMTTNELGKIMREYENNHKEKKNLFNKISILFGCLTAVILI